MALLVCSILPLQLTMMMMMISSQLLLLPPPSSASTSPPSSSSSSCHFPALYNFGDSNSDTGSQSAVFGRLPNPNGDTFFGRPSGRRSDGRLIIDFLAEKLGVPYLSSFLDSMESNFTHGANFASSGATVQPPSGELLNSGFNPITFQYQFLQFHQLIERTFELQQKQGGFWWKNSGGGSNVINRLPKPEELEAALYTLDCGQNDLDFGLTDLGGEQGAISSIPMVIQHFALAIQNLYKEGGRTFWIHNTGPIGCLPLFVIKNPPRPGNADPIGCIKSYNQVAQEFNRQLNQTVYRLRTQFPDALFILVDIYSAKYSLISQAETHGFEDPFGFCCGHLGDDYEVGCGGEAKLGNGTIVYGNSCKDPKRYISWDNIHYTEAASRWVADRIANGSFSDPPIPITQACTRVGR